MLQEVEELTVANARSSFILLDDDTPCDLAGTHEAQVIAFRKKKSEKGNRYYWVGYKIVSDAGEGEVVYGPVFKGRQREKFFRALGVDPTSLDRRIEGEEIIGAKVRITVERDSRDGQSAAEDWWTVKQVEPLA